MAQGGMATLVAKLYERSAAVLTHLQSPLLLIIRLYWGWQFYIAGRGKLLNLDRTAGFFASINIPMPKLNAAIAGSVECFGGWLLLLGLGSRFISIPLMFTMIVAYGTAHRDVLATLFSKSEDFISAPPFNFLMAVLIVLAFGPGLFSLDALISKKLAGSESGTETKSVYEPPQKF